MKNVGRLTGVITLCLWAGISVGAEALPGGDIASVRSWLQTHNPELRALQAEAEAAQARIVPAGALPNPVASIELDDIDSKHLTLAPANVGTTTYRVRQPFPLWGKRGLAQDIASAEADAAGFRRDAIALERISDAESAFIVYWHAGEALRILERLNQLLASIENVARASYQTGQAPQQDVLRAQVERTTLLREQIRRRVEQHHAMAELNRALGRELDAPLAEPSEPSESALTYSSMDQLLTRLRDGQHPALQASAAQVAAATQNKELTRRDRYPDISVSLGAMQRGDRLDSYELMFELTLPLQQRARRERERATSLLESAAQARAEADLLELERQLGVAWANWHGAKSQRELIDNTLLIQAKANYQSALASYRTGAVDFSTLLEALRSWQNAELERIDARRDELSGAIKIAAIAGDLP